MAGRELRGGYHGAVFGCGESGIMAVDLLQRKVNFYSDHDYCPIINTIAVSSSVERLGSVSADLHVLAESPAAVTSCGGEIHDLLGYLDYCFIIYDADGDTGLAQAVAQVVREQCGCDLTIAVVSNLSSGDSRYKQTGGMPGDAVNLTIVIDQATIDRCQPGLAAEQGQQTVLHLVVATVELFLDYCVRPGIIDTYLHEVFSLARVSDSGIVYYLTLDESAKSPEALQAYFRSRVKKLPDCAGMLAVIYTSNDAGLTYVGDVMQAFIDAIKPDLGNLCWNVQVSDKEPGLIALVTLNNGVKR